MSDVVINYRGNSIATMDASGTKTLQTEGKYCDDDIEVVYTKPSPPPSPWTLIDTATLELQDFTSTTAEEVATGINISDTDYEFIAVVVTCSAPISLSTEWGMSVHMVGRNSAGRVYANSGSAVQQVGKASLSFAVAGGEQTSGSYGVYVGNNKTSIVLVRKCDSSHITKIRGGTYTVKVYGLSSL